MVSGRPEVRQAIRVYILFALIAGGFATLLAFVRWAAVTNADQRVFLSSLVAIGLAVGSFWLLYHYLPDRLRGQAEIRTIVFHPTESMSSLHLPQFVWVLGLFASSMVISTGLLVGAQLVANPTLSLGLVAGAALPLFVAAISPALLWLALLYARRQFGPEPRGWVLVALAWGMLAVFPALMAQALLSSTSSTLLGEGTALGDACNLCFLSTIFSPLFEEAIKAVGLVFLLRQISNELDGTVYGFSIGLGFMVLSNLLAPWVGLGAGDPLWMMVVLLFARTLSGWFHAIGPAFVGYALGYVVRRGLGINALPVLALVYGAAAVNHLAWNLLSLTYVQLLFFLPNLMMVELVALAGLLYIALERIFPSSEAAPAKEAPPRASHDHPPTDAIHRVFHGRAHQAPKHRKKSPRPPTDPAAASEHDLM